MAIILEGMDGSGKSTLATRIALPISHPGAPPKSADEEAWHFRDQWCKAGEPITMDRVTCISQQVYRKRMFDEWYTKPLQRLVKTPFCVVVYCRPPDEALLDMSRLQAAEHDTPEMLQLVRDNAQLFVRSYDELMATIPHVVYDFTTTNLQEFLLGIVSTQYHIKEWDKCMSMLKATHRPS